MLIAPADQVKMARADSNKLSDQMFALMKSVDESSVATLDELLIPAFKIQANNFESSSLKVADGKFMNSLQQNCTVQFGPLKVDPQLVKYNLKTDPEDECKARGIGMPLNYTVSHPNKKIVCLNEAFVVALNDTDLEEASEQASIVFAA